MKQFEVRRLRSGGLVLLIQHDVLDDLESCIVAPLSRSPKLVSMPRLRPKIDVEGVAHAVLMDRLAAVSRSGVGAFVLDARDLRDEVNLALDFLFKGF